MKTLVKVCSLAVTTALLTCTLALASPAPASALCVQWHMTVKMVGVDEADGTIYVEVVDGGDGVGIAPCSGPGNVHTIFRFKGGETATQAILSVLLAAKLSGAKIRIDKRVDSDKNSAFRAFLL